MLQLHIAILTHNALDYSRKCFLTLREHTRIPHRIYILDNASTDGTPAWLNSLEGVEGEVSPLNLGVAGGRNHLMRKILAKAQADDLIVFLDNDTELLPGWYEPFLDLYAREPKAGVLGVYGLRASYYGDKRAWFLPNVRKGPTFVDAVAGFCFWVPVSLCRKLGEFDEKVGLFWHEDDDYCLRAIQAGYHVFALPQAGVLHHGHKSVQHTIDARPAEKYLIEKWRRSGALRGTRIHHPGGISMEHFHFESRLRQLHDLHALTAEKSTGMIMGMIRGFLARLLGPILGPQKKFNEEVWSLLSDLVYVVGVQQEGLRQKTTSDSAPKVRETECEN